MIKSSHIRVGIVGLGRSGWGIHAETLIHLKNYFSVVAACDVLSSRCEDARVRFGCQTFIDFHEMLKCSEIDLIVIATPNLFHTPYSIAALNSGFNVLVEKPFALNLSDAEAMITAGHRNKRVITCNQNYRYVEDFVKVREVLATGKIGEVINIKKSWLRFARRWDWQTLQSYGGGELFNIGPHLVDQIIALTGITNPDVFCWLEQTPAYAGDAESHVKIILSSPSKPIIELDVSRVCCFPVDEWIIMGTHGGISGGRKKLEVRYFDSNQVVGRMPQIAPTPDRGYNHEDLPWNTMSYSFKDDLSHSYQLLYLDLYNSIVSGQELPVSESNILDQIKILDTCRELVLRDKIWIKKFPKVIK